jgi:hypothetical protein
MAEDRWHQPLVHVPGWELRTDTSQTTGMTRREAISGKTRRGGEERTEHRHRRMDNRVRKSLS